MIDILTSDSALCISLLVNIILFVWVWSIQYKEDTVKKFNKEAYEHLERVRGLINDPYKLRERILWEYDFTIADGVATDPHGLIQIDIEQGYVLETDAAEALRQAYTEWNGADV